MCDYNLINNGFIDFLYQKYSSKLGKNIRNPTAFAYFSKHPFIYKNVLQSQIPLKLVYMMASPKAFTA